MIPQPIQTYFFFGTCVRYLQDIPENSGIGDTHEGWGVRTNLRIFTYLDDLNMSVSSRMAPVGELKGVLAELKKSNDSAGLSVGQAQRISNAMNGLRNTLEAELRGIEAYTVTPKRYDVATLLDRSDEIFAPGVFDVLPSIAQFDWRRLDDVSRSSDLPQQPFTYFALPKRYCAHSIGSLSDEAEPQLCGGR
jgi:hypothetical protein